jgi:hypothetical protein
MVTVTDICGSGSFKVGWRWANDDQEEDEGCPCENWRGGAGTTLDWPGSSIGTLLDCGVLVKEGDAPGDCRRRNAFEKGRIDGETRGKAYVTGHNMPDITGYLWRISEDKVHDIKIMFSLGCRDIGVVELDGAMDVM